MSSHLRPCSSQWLFLWQFLVILKKQFVTNALFFKKIQKKWIKKKSIPKSVTICLQYKRVLRFSTFIFWKWKKLIKYTYGLLPLEQHHKIENNNNYYYYWATVVNLLLFNPESAWKFYRNDWPVKYHVWGFCKTSYAVFYPSDSEDRKW
jgi:hypothetical protein